MHALTPNTAQTLLFSTHAVGAIQPFQPFQFGLWKLFKSSALESATLSNPGIDKIDKIIPVIYGNSWKEQTKTLTSYCGVILIQNRL